MTILMVTRKLDPSDWLAGFAYDWVCALAARVGRLLVITLQPGPEATLANVAMQRMRRDEWDGRILTLMGFHRAIREWGVGADVFFAHMNPEYALLCAPYARMWGKPLIFWYTHGSISWRLRLACRLSHLVLTASRESCRIERTNVRVVGHGINVDRFAYSPPADAGSTEGPAVLLSVGRISPAKRIEVLIDALRILRSKGVPCVLRIAGGPGSRAQELYAEQLRVRAHQQGLSDGVQWLGPVSHGSIVHQYHHAAVVLSASQTGSVDKVILEAMSCGRPVVTSNPAFREVLGSHADRLVFRDGDSRDLAERVVGVLREDRATLGRELREIVVRNHSLDRLMDRVTGMMRQLTSG